MAPGESYLEYGLITLSDVMIEQDPHAWWALTRRAIGLALDAAGADRRAVRGLSVSSQGISFVLLDGEGQPLGNAINWLDGRAINECTEILARYPAETLFRATGKRAAPFYVLPKLLWIRKHQPEVWRRARSVMMGHDYLVYRLCGERVTDHSMAGARCSMICTGWIGARSFSMRSPSPTNCFRPCAGLARQSARSCRPWPRSWGCRRMSLSRSAGRIRVRGARRGDRGRLGHGIAGTASAIVQVMDRPATDPGMRIPTFAFVQPRAGCWRGSWVRPPVACAGIVIRWRRASPTARWTTRLRLPSRRRRRPLLSAPGRRGQPTLAEQRTGHFHGLSRRRRGHLTRAVSKGSRTESVRTWLLPRRSAGPWRGLSCRRRRQERAVARDHRRRAGAARGLDADAETAGLGAAMLAGLGCGVFASLDEAPRMRTVTQQQRPTFRAATYEAAFETYRRFEAGGLLGIDGFGQQQ